MWSQSDSLNSGGLADAPKWMLLLYIKIWGIMSVFFHRCGRKSCSEHISCIPFLARADEQCWSFLYSASKMLNLESWPIGTSSGFRCRKHMGISLRYFAAYLVHTSFIAKWSQEGQDYEFPTFLRLCRGAIVLPLKSMAEVIHLGDMFFAGTQNFMLHRECLFFYHSAQSEIVFEDLRRNAHTGKVHERAHEQWWISRCFQY